MPTRINYPIEWKHSYSGIIINGKQEIKLPPLPILKWLFSYNSETGELFRIRQADGKEINPPRLIKTDRGDGYIQVSISDSNGLKKLFLAHRICWYIHYGAEPTNTIDHINGIRTDNRISNLRVVDTTINNRNKSMSSRNKSGYTGVCWYKSTNKWMAYIFIEGKNKHLGLYDTIDEAVLAREQFIDQFNLNNPKVAFHANHGLSETKRNAPTIPLSDNVIPFPSIHVANASNHDYTAAEVA